MVEDMEALLMKDGASELAKFPRLLEIGPDLWASPYYSRIVKMAR